MNWKGKRLEDLNARLFDKVELLGEYEKEFDYEQEPSAKRRLKDIIQKLKEEINEITFEIEQTQKPVLEEFPKPLFETNLNLTEIRQEYYEEYIQRKRKEKN